MKTHTAVLMSGKQVLLQYKTVKKNKNVSHEYNRKLYNDLIRDRISKLSDRRGVNVNFSGKHIIPLVFMINTTNVVN